MDYKTPRSPTSCSGKAGGFRFGYAFVDTETNFIRIYPDYNKYDYNKYEKKQKSTEVWAHVEKDYI